MEKLQFLDYTDLNPVEEEQLNNLLYNGDSSEFVELPPENLPTWIQHPVPYQPDSMGMGEDQVVADGDLQPQVDYTTGNPVMAPHTMQYTHMMPPPSVYVSNVTANVNVHSFVPQGMPYGTPLPYIQQGSVDTRKPRPSKTPTKRSPDMRGGVRTPQESPQQATTFTPQMFTPPYYSPGLPYPAYWGYPQYPGMGPASPHPLQQPMRQYVSTVVPPTFNPNAAAYQQQAFVQPESAAPELVEENTLVQDENPAVYPDTEEETLVPSEPEVKVYPMAASVTPTPSYDQQSSEEEMQPPTATVDTVVVENNVLQPQTEVKVEDPEEPLEVVENTEAPKAVKVEKPKMNKAPPANAFKSTPALNQKPPFPTGPAKQKLIDSGPEFIDPPVDLGPPKKSYASLFGATNRASCLNHYEVPVSKPLAMIHPTVHNNNSNNKGVSQNNHAEKPSAHAKDQSPNPLFSNSSPKTRMADEITFQDYDINLQRLGEFLSGYQLEHKPLTLQPRGLTNRSNYCYVNAILQALVACPPFYNLMKAIPASQENKGCKSRIPITDSMVKFVNEFSPMSLSTRPVGRREKTAASKDREGDVVAGPAFEPAYVYKMLSAMHAQFPVEGRQEDAEEFLSCLLNGLNDEMLEAMKLIEPQSNGLSNGDVTTNGVVTTNGDHEPEQDHEWTEVVNTKNKSVVTRRTEFGRTPLSAIFRGQMRSRVTRAGIENSTTDNVQPFFTLQLDIEKANSVEKALELLVGKDEVVGGTCPKTNQEISVFTQTSLEELPLILLLHLKCFDYKLHTCSKIIKSVEFPIDLKIDGKLLTNKTKTPSKDRMYKLFAVVYHDGKEATKGHYITDVYHMGYSGWVRYDDASVRPISSQQVLNPRSPRVPYLLYYRRCDTIAR